MTATGNLPCQGACVEINVIRYIGAVTREVQSRDYDGRPARVVVASCAYDTTIDDVWDAITNAERIPRRFLPISGELRLGGRYQLQCNASGQITSCEPPVVWRSPGSSAVRSAGFTSASQNCRTEALGCSWNISRMCRMISGISMVPGLLVSDGTLRSWGSAGISRRIGRRTQRTLQLG